jgi:glycosyltransferase involved in cell wall biosynthesis
MVRPPMRIAVLEPAGHGGLLHYSVQLAEGLAARGHAVDIIAPRDNELVGRVRHARMRAILPVPLRPGATAASRSAHLRRRAGVAVRLLRAWGRMLWETRPGRYDAVVHGADIGLPPVALATLLMSVIPRRPLLVRIAHNVRAFNRRGGDELFDPSPLNGALLRRLYPRFDLVLVHGERSRADFEEAWGPARLAVIPHGDERIFADGPPPASSEERVLFFGDWRKVKGLAVLMEAFDELVRRRPEARLTVAGTPAPEDWDPGILRKWARGHEGRVEVIDRYVPIAEVAPTFARARVVTTPYLTGYQSGVIHLAATMGRPVVTSDVGDLASAVSEGVTGRVVPPGDARELAAALEEILADAQLAARMGAAARRSVLEGSSWERVACRVEEELLALR